MVILELLFLSFLIAEQLFRPISQVFVVINRMNPFFSLVALVMLYLFS